jgi:hypothetical protein
MKPNNMAEAVISLFLLFKKNYFLVPKHILPKEVSLLAE